MLKENEYKKQWESIGNSVSKIYIPSYYKYLQREVYFQDYLDLFIGNKTETFSRMKIDGKETVIIPGLKQDLSVDRLTRVDSNGVVRLVVDHDFPYRNLLGTKRMVKYLLIGEAAPASGKYIYKDASSAYMTAPLLAKGIDPDRMVTSKHLKEWEIAGLNKDHEKAKLRLVKFALNGFLHLDLFPFAFDFNEYGKLRKELSKDKKLIAVFMIYLEKQVKSFMRLGIISPNWDYCFVGPKITSKALIDHVNITTNKSFLGKTIVSVNDINVGDKFKGSADYICRVKPPGSNLQHLPRIAKLTVIMGGTGPNHELVKRALHI